VERLDLADALLIAEIVLGANAEAIALIVDVAGMESALAAPFAGFGDFELYPGFHVKAAVLCSRIIRNHPLPDGNKRTGYLAMREFVERNDRTWTTGDQDEAGDTIERLAAREIDEEQFAAWVAKRIS
jgi:death-on-curing protein